MTLRAEILQFPGKLTFSLNDVLLERHLVRHVVACNNEIRSFGRKVLRHEDVDALVLPWAFQFEISFLHLIDHSLLR